MAKTKVKVPIQEKIGLTIQEAAALLGLSEKTVYNLVHTEGFPAVRATPGGRWTVNRLRLQEWMDKWTGVQV